jgi:hypothetical protein
MCVHYACADPKQWKWAAQFWIPGLCLTRWAAATAAATVAVAAAAAAIHFTQPLMQLSLIKKPFQAPIHYSVNLYLAN